MMGEHWIRLRGAWKGDFSERRGPAADRVDLPVDWPPEIRSPFVLSRSFQRPRVDFALESVVLRIDQAPGVREVRLAGSLLPLDPGAPFPWECELPETLPPRIELQVLVDPAAWAADGEPARAWGAFALVIRPRA